jgi:hypothetical protein
MRDLLPAARHRRGGRQAGAPRPAREPRTSEQRTTHESETSACLDAQDTGARATQEETSTFYGIPFTCGESMGLCYSAGACRTAPPQTAARGRPRCGQQAAARQPPKSNARPGTSRGPIHASAPKGSFRGRDSSGRGRAGPPRGARGEHTHKGQAWLAWEASCVGGRSCVGEVRPTPMGPAGRAPCRGWRARKGRAFRGPRGAAGWERMKRDGASEAGQPDRCRSAQFPAAQKCTASQNPERKFCVGRRRCGDAPP